MRNFEKVIGLLKAYKEEHGDCLVPHSYITESGVHLGNIVNSLRSGSRKTTLEEREKLDSLGFVWSIKRRFPFNEVVSLLKEYKEEYGDCLVPKSHITKNGIRLGSIVGSIRNGNRKTTPEQREILDSLGFAWKVNENLSFGEVVSLLKAYKEKNGDCLVPVLYKTEDGVSLGRIVSNIRSGNRRTTFEEKEVLNNLGFVWAAKESVPFHEVVSLLKEYKKEHGDCLVSEAYTTHDGVALGIIVSNIRSGNRKTTLEEREMLENLGFVWRIRKRFSFTEVASLLKAYKEEHGDCLVPKSYTTHDGIKLGELISNIRKENRKTTPEEKAILDSLGFVWDPKKGRRS